MAMVAGLEGLAGRSQKASSATGSIDDPPVRGFEG